MLMQPESNLSYPSLPIKLPVSKPPTEILSGIFAFPPNRDTLGGTAYLILAQTGNILIDSPAWNDANQQFIADHGGVRSLAITHRGGIGATTTIATALGCKVIIQEQEAYLLPELKTTTFSHKFNINDSIHAFWTSGHSPGSVCIYSASNGGVLFTGRHLLPDQFGAAVPLRIPKTFHWKRQLLNVEAIWAQFPSQYPLAHICPGANTGLLRGKGSILVDHVSSDKA
jgi:glyoxylase-like metal-dependent hydrolase (beta-lactamase superfamily II)